MGVNIKDNNGENIYTRKFYFFYCDIDGACNERNIESIEGYSLEELYSSSHKYNLVIPLNKFSCRFLAFKENTFQLF